MAIETTTNRASFAGNGVTTAFSFPYKFLSQSDLKVYLRVNSTAVETLKTITTHYTVTGAGEDAGGTVTMLTAPASGETLIIYNDPSATQGTDLGENDALPAETLEDSLDKLTILTQRLKDRVDRAVRLTDAFSPSFTPTLPSNINEAADKVPLINATGDGFADCDDWPSADDIDNAQTNATAAAASAVAAAASEVAAAASEASAAATLASAFYRDVIYITSASSPVTIAQAQNGYLYVADTSGGAITVNLPAIAGVTLPFNIAFLLKTAGNDLTINRASTDTIMGATSKVISAANTGAQLVADTGASPDDWSAMDLGTVADLGITTAKLASSAVTTAKIADTNVTLAKLVADVQAALVPVGSVLPFAGTSAPTGYLLCDGSAVSRTTYAALFTVISETHGQGDNSTTFNLPDYRGRFLRGVDGATARDPNAATRTAMNTGGNTGDNVGSLQTDAMQGHYHNMLIQANGDGASYARGATIVAGTTIATGVTAPITDGTNGTPRTSSETRPINAYVNYIIKY